MTAPTLADIQDSINVAARKDADEWASSRVASLPSSLTGADYVVGILGLIKQLVRSSEHDTPYAAALWRQFSFYFGKLDDIDKYAVQKAAIEPFREPLPPAVKFWRTSSRRLGRPAIEKWQTNAWTLYNDLAYKFPYGVLTPIPTGLRVSIPKGYVGLIHPHWFLANKGVVVWAREPISPKFDEEIKVHARTVARGVDGYLTEIPEYAPLCYLVVVKAGEVRALFEDEVKAPDPHDAELCKRPPQPPDYGQW